MSLTLFFVIALFTHWVADFIIQTKNMKSQKSYNLRYLALHIISYSAVTTLVWIICLNLSIDQILSLFLFIAAPHFLTDFITSKVTKALWKEEEYNLFFIVLGFDQLLHYAALYLAALYFI